MISELLDRYLLQGRPGKDEVVRQVLDAGGSAPAAAAPFLEGIRMLGARTPDLSLVALRLVLAGRRADDESVTSLRALSERARKGGEDGAEAAEAYRTLLSES